MFGAVSLTIGDHCLFRKDVPRAPVTEHRTQIDAQPARRLFGASPERSSHQRGRDPPWEVVDPDDRWLPQLVPIASAKLLGTKHRQAMHRKIMVRKMISSVHPPSRSSLVHRHSEVALSGRFLGNLALSRSFQVVKQVAGKCLEPKPQSGTGTSS